MPSPCVTILAEGVRDSVERGRDCVDRRSRHVASGAKQVGASRCNRDVGAGTKHIRFPPCLGQKIGHLTAVFATETASFLGGAVRCSLKIEYRPFLM